MKVSGITILLAGIAAMAANAQVLKGTASSSNPRRRFNKMKEADRRRLQTTIACVGIGGKSSSTVDGYGDGCVEQDGPVDCASGGDSFCKSNGAGYNECFDSGTNPTNRCVCIIPGSSTTCKDDFGGTNRPCCTEG